MSGFFLILAFIAILFFTIMATKDSIKELSVWRSIGIILSFFITIAIAALLLHFGGNWFAGHVANPIIENVIFFIVVALVILLLSFVLNKVIKMLTKGAS